MIKCKTQGRNSDGLVCSDAWLRVAEFDEEVIMVMKWYLCSDRKRKRLAMIAGGVQEVVQQAFIDLIEAGPKDVSAKWTTIACKRVWWTCIWMAKKEIREKNFKKRSERSEQIIDGFRRCELDELAVKCEHVMSTIKDERRRTVLMRRLHGSSLDELSKVFRVCKQRIITLEQSAIEMLQLPNVAGELVGFLD
jgi:DNA-directed RNA polymerase specialized sigma24 family protein